MLALRRARARSSANDPTNQHLLARITPGVLRDRRAVARRAIARRHSAELHRPPSFNFPPAGWSTQWYINFFTDPSWLYRCRRASGSVPWSPSWRRHAAQRPRWRSAAPGSSVTGYGRCCCRRWSCPSSWWRSVYTRFPAAQSTWHDTGIRRRTQRARAAVRDHPGVGASLQGFDRRLEDAAAICGAGRWTVFRTVTLPIVAPGVMSGALVRVRDQLRRSRALIVHPESLPPNASGAHVLVCHP